MTIRHTYTSAPIHYEGIGDDEPPLYNLWLRVFPRQYDETIQQVKAVFAIAGRTAISESTICVLTAMTTVKWPSWKMVVNKFDGNSGGYLGRDDLGLPTGPDSLSASTQFVSIGRNNDIWYSYLSTKIRRASISGWQYSGVEFPYNFFDPVIQWPWAVDHLANRLLAAGATEILIYSLTGGLLLSRIPVGGRPRSIFFEDSHRAYCVLETGVFVLCDYMKGEVLGVFRVDLRDDSSINTKRFGWEPYTRRILTLETEADDEDGSSNTKVRGYYPIPVGVAMTPPIPLRVPRKFRRDIPLATRVYGNCGEPISGTRVTMAISGNSVLAPGQIDTDLRGYAICNLVAGDPDEVTVDAEAVQMATLEASATFEIGDGDVATEQSTLFVLPIAGVGEGSGRLIHPTIGTYDYDNAPDETRGLSPDGDIVTGPLVLAERALSGTALTHWPTDVRDAVIEERWTDEICMTVDQLTMLIAMYTQTPAFPDYVAWFPSYAGNLGFYVVMTSLTVAGQDVNLDAIIEQGWVVGPVVLTLQVVGRVDA